MKADDDSCDDLWMRQIDRALQFKIGTLEEREYFSVMHMGGVKVLWHRPEDYEHACGQEIDEDLKKKWYERTGKERMQFIVHEEDPEEWQS